MDDGIAAGEGLAHVGGIAQVALDLAEPRIAVEPGKDVAVDEKIEHRDLVAGIEKLRHEIRADVTGAPGDQDALESPTHRSSDLPLCEQSRP